MKLDHYFNHGMQVQRLLVQLAEGGLLCPARLLQSALAKSATLSFFELAWLRCLHPQLHLPSLSLSRPGTQLTDHL